MIEKHADTRNVWTIQALARFESVGYTVVPNLTRHLNGVARERYEWLAVTG